VIVPLIRLFLERTSRRRGAATNDIEARAGRFRHSRADTGMIYIVVFRDCSLKMRNDSRNDLSAKSRSIIRSIIRRKHRDKKINNPERKYLRLI